jgi:hypothetical protein
MLSFLHGGVFDGEILFIILIFFAVVALIIYGAIRLRSKLGLKAALAYLLSMGLLYALLSLNEQNIVLSLAGMFFTLPWSLILGPGLSGVNLAYVVINTTIIYYAVAIVAYAKRKRIR